MAGQKFDLKAKALAEAERLAKEADAARRSGALTIAITTGMAEDIAASLRFLVADVEADTGVTLVPYRGKVS